MNAPLGFMLLTHTHPHQAVRLVERLNVMFNFPPIVWHHDDSKRPMPEAKFPGNVSFVRPSLKTQWTEFSVVEAELRLMRQMLALPNPPERIVLLSGQDYPIKPASRILADLQAGDFDGHFLFFLTREDLQGTRNDRLNYRRHLCFNFPPPPLFRWMKRNWPMFTLRYRGPFKYLQPFSRELECYAGHQWFVANRRLVEYILEYHRTHPRLAWHYRHRMFSDECYFHTIVCNAPQLKINNNDWRYIDWSGGSKNPKTLGMEDLPKMMASTAHFARKLDISTGTELFDRLDEMTRENS